MNFGFDVDGVLANFNESFMERIVEVTKADLFPASAWAGQIPTWNYPQHFGYSEDLVSRVWANIKDDESFWFQLSVLPSGFTLLDWLYRMKNRDHNYYFITDRPGKRSKWQTEQWVKKWIYSGNPTVLLSNKKGPAAEALALDFYIDDKYENVFDVAERSPKTSTYLLTAPYNEKFNLPNATNRLGPITRVATIREALEHKGAWL